MRSTIEFRVWRAFAELLGWLLLCFLAALAIGGVTYSVSGGGSYMDIAIGIPTILVLPFGFIHAVVRNLVITTTQVGGKHND